MEDYIEIFLVVIMALVVIATIVTNFKNYQERKMQSFSKIIYNYKAKTQKQIYSILQLELEELQEGGKFSGLEVHKFTSPVFRKDGSAYYTVYLKLKYNY